MPGTKMSASFAILTAENVQKLMQDLLDANNELMMAPASSMATNWRGAVACWSRRSSAASKSES